MTYSTQVLYVISLLPYRENKAILFSSFQFSPLTDLIWSFWKVMNDSAEILFQSFLQEALVSSSSMGRDVHSLMLSIQHFLCRPRRRSPSKVPWRMVLERMWWRVTCPNHVSFRLLTIARRGSCLPSRKLILLRTQSLVLRSKEEMRRSFLVRLVPKAWILFFRVSK